MSEDIREALVLRYCTYTAPRRQTKSGPQKKWITMEEHETVLGHTRRKVAGGPLVELKIADIELRSMRRKGDWYEKDTTCDSEWMKVHMLEMGKAIREAYWWVADSQEIELVMENAGGHGTKDCIEEYEKALKEKFNVKVIHQVPRSPETNLLDLGIWCGLQHYVETVHRKKTKTSTDALARTVINAWSRYNSFESFANVYRRWDKVLSLIIGASGDNSLVDSARKELIVPIVMVAPEALIQDEDHIVEDPPKTGSATKTA
eukprot:Sro94_g048770.2  (261) ;mRNA; f:2271-3053